MRKRQHDVECTNVRQQPSTDANPAHHALVPEPSALQDMDIADANSPEGLWGAIVDLLETFQQEAATRNVDFLLLGLQGSINAAAQERTPKAVWKKLIADDEVCFYPKGLVLVGTQH